ncbi:rRNA small subunit methyltransferase B [Sulfitobacter noctilucicola]|uniref:16S rRNA (Cytosine967-C5)-methyltransferase n=1 Tax=Sulfitobacter noctilucicola TaxID=1342301 RepID=A0A7W6M7C0_9RHOB|nr:RsmB/NOP family class I SAM-dependent RNA methyltransferase [Sulfitobacter noctilucicola]KIN65085.1 rRNA small subunit methyltransferase B [Sulfitobacter noctilucicola]MBB4173775.1 16S rRNA (cytosine967-C5)-methyltransferase [Sulfitobacter noctilucicola]
MTPGARVAAAIEILADMTDGLAAEQALTRWARRSRFAGSKDRAAIRDHVFDVLRCRRTTAHMGQGETPRALMIGALRLQQADLDALFSGEGHSPVPLSEQERMVPEMPSDTAVLMNLPDWLIPHFDESLGPAAMSTALALQERAPVFLRTNAARISRDDAIAALASEGIEASVNPICDTALTVIEGARKIRNSQPYLEGLVELQDGASQAVVSALPTGRRVLDFCAGGGGKALAIAAQPDRAVTAHDIDPRRMQDIASRAERAEVQIKTVASEDLEGGYDVVLCDAPCSGSGAWRRSAEAKWTLTQDRLTELTTVQDDILDQAARLLAPAGALVFATCSVLHCENEARVAAFLKRHPDWSCSFEQRFAVGADGDGFFTAHLIRGL